VDEAEVPQVDLPDYDDLHMAPTPTRYPKAGDLNPTVRVAVIGAKGGAWNALRWLDLGLEPDDYIARVQWTPHNALLIQRIPRLQNRIDLLLVDPATGVTRTILTETDPAWINAPGDLTFIPNAQDSVEREALSVKHATEAEVSSTLNTQRSMLDAMPSTPNAQRPTPNALFLWPSDRDGFRHLYLYDTDGTLLRQLTQGEWEVDAIVGADRERGVYFTAAHPVPQDRQLFRVSLEGGEPQGLTSEPGIHSIFIARNAAHYLDTYSTRACAPQVRLHRHDGEFVGVVHANAMSKLANVPLGRWEFTSFETEEGITLHAAMLKPHDFDPTKRYPVVMYTYGGPGSQVATDQWNGRGLDQLLAAQGFLYVMVDGRGSGMRGRDFMKTTYLNLGHYEVEDQIAGAKWLGSLPYVDANRIGIWGWSYGGYMASLCILRGAEVFRSAVAVAPVTHWQLYDSIYTERYMRRPIENPEGYERSSPLTYVERLKGAFLLIHGTADDNVHYQNTLRLAAELQKQAKPFRMMAYPGKRHDIADVPMHLFGTIADFLTETLTG
jgi:dipeptidyl-peptidase-4